MIGTLASAIYSKVSSSSQKYTLKDSDPISWYLDKFLAGPNASGRTGALKREIPFCCRLLSLCKLLNSGCHLVLHFRQEIIPGPYATQHHRGKPDSIRAKGASAGPGRWCPHGLWSSAGRRCPGLKVRPVVFLL